MSSGASAWFLAEHPSSPELGEDEVKAFVLPADPAPTPEAIVNWCQERLARFKVPRFVEFVSDFPRSAAKQEIERHRLKARPNDKAWDREKAGV